MFLLPPPPPPTHHHHHHHHHHPSYPGYPSQGNTGGWFLAQAARIERVAKITLRLFTIFETRTASKAWRKQGKETNGHVSDVWGI